MTRPLRIAAVVFLLGLLAAWILWVAIVSDFNEAAVLLLGGLWLLMAFLLGWTTRRVAVKTALLAFGIAAMLVFGVSARTATSYRQTVRRIMTQNLLHASARALVAYRTQTGALPDHEYRTKPKAVPERLWERVAPLLDAQGAWTVLRVPYDGSDHAETYVHAPRRDQWGCRFRYLRLDDGRFDLSSSGADRRWNTPDDLQVTSETILPETVIPLPVYQRQLLPR
jgi:hypothetical protein